MIQSESKLQSSFSWESVAGTENLCSRMLFIHSDFTRVICQRRMGKSDLTVICSCCFSNEVFLQVFLIAAWHEEHHLYPLVYPVRHLLFSIVTIENKAKKNPRTKQNAEMFTYHETSKGVIKPSEPVIDQDLLDADLAFLNAKSAFNNDNMCHHYLCHQNKVYVFL